jgi:hypothetical protein
VRDPGLVDGRERGRGADGQALQTGARTRSRLGHHALQRRALDELADDVRPVVLHPAAEDLGGAEGRDPLGDGGLADEPLDHDRVLGVLRAQPFHRHLSSGPVGGEVDDALPAFAESPEELVVSQPGRVSCSQSREIWHQGEAPPLVRRYARMYGPVLADVILGAIAWEPLW